MDGKFQKLMDGANEVAVGTLIKKNLAITCMEGYKKANNAAEWTDDSVDLTFATAANANDGATLKGGATSYADFTACEQVDPVKCNVNLLKDAAFEVYESESTPTKSTKETVNLAEKLFVTCEKGEYAGEAVEGAMLKAYQCGADGTFGKLFFACNEYKNCTTLQKCQTQLCNGGFLLHPSLAILAALLAAFLL